MFGGLDDTLLATRHRTDLAGQPHLAEHHQLTRQRAVLQAGDHRTQHREVGAGLEHLDPADHVQEDILIAGEQATMLVEHCQQHRQAIAVQADGDTAGIAQRRVIQQGLHFDQDRPRALPHHHHQTAGGLLLAARQEDRAGVLHLLQAQLDHGEHAQLVDRAEAVLLATQRAEARITIALQQQGGVDHVLQHLGAGQRAVLGHVADQQQHGVGSLGEAGQRGGRLTHLRDTPRRG